MIPLTLFAYLIQICLSTSRCEEGYGVQSLLKGRILGVGEARPADYDLFLQCHNCGGQVYLKNETRIEAEIGPIKEAMTGPKGKVQNVRRNLSIAWEEATIQESSQGKTSNMKT
jgi:hypothetical protein